MSARTLIILVTVCVSIYSLPIATTTKVSIPLPVISISPPKAVVVPTFKIEPYKLKVLPQWQPKGTVPEKLEKSGVPEKPVLLSGNGEPCGTHEHGQSALTAMLLSLFLGPFGAHRFYYDYYGTGCIQCVITVALIALHRVIKKAVTFRKDKLSNLSCIGQFSLLTYMMLCILTVLWWGTDVVLVATQYLKPQGDYCLHPLGLDPIAR